MNVNINAVLSALTETSPLTYFQNYFSSVTNIIDFTLSFVLLLAVTLGFSLKYQRGAVVLISVGSDICYLLSMLFGFTAFRVLVAVIMIVCYLIFAFVNSGILSGRFARALAPVKVDPKKKTAEEDGLTLEEKAELRKNLTDAIQFLSSRKTGALITIEKKDKLDSICTNGAKVHCLVTDKILETIFYEGTVLHDGAVVIRGNMIEYAAVFYKPSAAAMDGKYGARHRAALGISSESDSLTIVVSEETGQIHYAYQGKMTRIKFDQLSSFVEEHV